MKNQGLWANIHAKRKRIAKGSGEKMRKKGKAETGAPGGADSLENPPNQGTRAGTPSAPSSPGGGPGGGDEQRDQSPFGGGLIGGFFSALNKMLFGGENAKYGVGLGDFLPGLGGGGGLPDFDLGLGALLGGGANAANTPGPDLTIPMPGLGGDNFNPLPAPAPGEAQETPETQRRGQGNRQVASNPNRGGGLSKNQQALLNAIADAEGTSKYPNKGYNTHFTGAQTSDLSRHPRKMHGGNGYRSDAFGRYQFLSTTWAGLGIKGMSPANQDRGALKLVTGRGVNLSDGLSIQEIYRLGGEWASIEGGPQMKPGGSYGGQAKYSARQFMKMYQKYGGKRQGLQTGGMVQALGRAVAPTVMHFFEQSGVENQRMVQQEQPQVVNMGGGGGDPQGMTVMHTRGSNQPTYNLASRDSCPLSMYYRFHPSFNPQGMNP